MPGQRGSETRVRQNVLTTRWSQAELEQLDAITVVMGCSRAETLRRLVRRADKQVLATRALINQVRALGNNTNQIARTLNARNPVASGQLIDLYKAMLAALQSMRS